MADNDQHTTELRGRRRGVLLPLFSLPSEYGIGSIGRRADRFIDALADSGACIWGLLPTGPTGYGDSPYQSFSSFALNPYFLDLEYLIRKGLLTEYECRSAHADIKPGAIDYGMLFHDRMPLLLTAYARFCEAENGAALIRRFEKTAPWLDDYARFMAIKDMLGGAPWYEWPDGLKNREPEAMADIAEKISCEVGFYKFLQYVLSVQWKKLRSRAGKRGVRIMGDMPIYCAYDSADCWAYRGNFRFDGDSKPKEVAGVPPDYFCEDGQLWGNPVYDWRRMSADGYSFWMARLARASELYDMLRIDHFRGFASYYAVPADAENARKGVWRRAGGRELFEKAASEGLPLEIIAEDLGYITADVRKLLRETGFEGMQVLQFAFDGSRANPHINKPLGPRAKKLRGKVAYTGTHDNAPLAQWWDEADPETLLNARAYIKAAGVCGDGPEALIRALLRSDAHTVIIPAQDILGLGADSRINVPGTPSGNWAWRLTDEEFCSLADRMKSFFN